MFNKAFESKNLQYKINVSYAFCVSKYLQNKLESKQLKYEIMKEIMFESGIKIFYGEDEKYFDILFEWIFK